MCVCVCVCERERRDEGRNMKVQGNFDRFFFSLLNEMADWIGISVRSIKANEKGYLDP